MSSKRKIVWGATMKAVESYVSSSDKFVIIAGAVALNPKYVCG